MTVLQVSKHLHFMTLTIIMSDSGHTGRFKTVLNSKARLNSEAILNSKDNY